MHFYRATNNKRVRRVVSRWSSWPHGVCSACTTDFSVRLPLCRVRHWLKLGRDGGFRRDRPLFHARKAGNRPGRRKLRRENDTLTPATSGSRHGVTFESRPAWRVLLSVVGHGLSRLRPSPDERRRPIRTCPRKNVASSESMERSTTTMCLFTNEVAIKYYDFFFSGLPQVLIIFCHANTYCSSIVIVRFLATIIKKF